MLRYQGRAPSGSSSFIFMQFLGKFWPNNRLAPPPWGLAPPPLGNPGSATADNTQRRSYVKNTNSNRSLSFCATIMLMFYKKGNSKKMLLQGTGEMLLFQSTDCYSMHTMICYEVFFFHLNDIKNYCRIDYQFQSA